METETAYPHINYARAFINADNAGTTTLRRVLKFVHNKFNRVLTPVEKNEVVNFLDHCVTIALLRREGISLLFEPEYVLPNDTAEVAAGYCERLLDDETTQRVKLPFLVGLSTMLMSAEGIRQCRGMDALRHICAGDDGVLAGYAEAIMISWALILKQD